MWDVSILAMTIQIPLPDIFVTSLLHSVSDGPRASGELNNIFSSQNVWRTSSNTLTAKHCGPLMKCGKCKRFSDVVKNAYNTSFAKKYSTVDNTSHVHLFY